LRVGARLEGVGGEINTEGMGYTVTTIGGGSAGEVCFGGPDDGTGTRPALKLIMTSCSTKIKLRMAELQSQIVPAKRKTHPDLQTVRVLLQECESIAQREELNVELNIQTASCSYKSQLASYHRTE
jgi:hypothetical protein